MNWRTIFVVVFLLVLTRAICTAESGVASFYGHECAGRVTANGERFDPDSLTAACWNHAFNKRLLVRSLTTGRSVVVKCNDRGPSRRLHRIIDLSEAAFKQICDPKKGLTRVAIEELP